MDIDCSGANVRWPGASAYGLQLCISSTADNGTTIDELKSRVDGGDAIEVPGVGLYAEAADRHAVALFAQRVVDVYFGGDNIPVHTTREQFAALLQEIVAHLEAL